MDCISCIFLIKDNMLICSDCYSDLTLKRCEVEVYSGSEQNNVFAGYTSCKLLYCDFCKRFYIDKNELAEQKEIHGYYIKTKNISAFEDLRINYDKKNMPIVISNYSNCSYCSSDEVIPLTYRIHKLWIDINFGKTRNGFINILVPYCKECKRTFIRKTDELIIDEFIDNYVRIPGQKQAYLFNKKSIRC